MPLGFVTEMPTLLAAADVVLAKAGAASTLEPLALGTPVFHTSFVAGNEWANVEFCVDRGVGAWVPTGDAMLERLRPLVEDAAALRDLRARVDALDLADGATAIAEIVASDLLEAPAHLSATAAPAPDPSESPGP